MFNVLWISVGLATPLILAAMAGYFSERSGVINIGLEGMMLMAACAAALGGMHGGPVVGLIAAIASATILSVVHWLATQHYRLDHVISGMAINAIAAGGTNFLYGRFADPGRNQAIAVIPGDVYRTIAMIAPVLIYFFIRRSKFGLRLDAVGQDPEKARLAGVKPVRIRFFALLLTGVLCGLAGAYLVSDTGVFTDNMTSGRGYIALAALILAGWRPLHALFACLVFGFFSALNIVLQGTKIAGVTIPSEFWNSLPYLVTIVALAGFLGQNRTPSGLGKT